MLTVSDQEHIARVADQVEGRARLSERLQGPLALQQTLGAAASVRAQAWLSTLPGQAGEASRHLFAGGGKGLRPLLTLWSAQAAGGDGHLALPVAAAVELLHSGTLLHDDIVDGGEQRRGQPAARMIWGDGVAVLSGDFCFFAALESLLELQDLEVMGRAMAVARALAEGELMQLDARQRRALPNRAAYEAVANRKTGALFAFAAWGGARAVRAPDRVCQWLDRFGLHLGLAFQMVDDVLDFTGDPETLGKDVFVDLDNGTPSLPVVLAIEADPSMLGRLKLAGGDDARRELLRAAIVRSDVLERAQALARRATADAVASLAALPETEGRLALESMARLLEARLA